uniref:Uncharacterized protein n=1 Tax=Rhizophora mucronata TaxID=61149 RepID=A0A2P2NWG9_RHIMU
MMYLLLKSSEFVCCLQCSMNVTFFQKVQEHHRRNMS